MNERQQNRKGSGTVRIHWVKKRDKRDGMTILLAERQEIGDASGGNIRIGKRPQESHGFPQLGTVVPKADRRKTRL